MAFIDVHVLQTVPPSNINRDDTGSPKTAIFGGVRRARVSSQAWKRATRKYFNDHLEKSDIGYRTKRIVDLVAEKVVESGVVSEAAESAATKTVELAGVKVKAPKKAKGDGAAEPATPQSDYLVFISAGQIENLAKLAASIATEGRVVSKAEARAAFNEDQSFDVAMFGRMVADDAELNIDAAVQVSHAISVHAVDNEFDYFTAVDDLQQAENIAGAGMIGTVEFNSSTLYRYATINLELLRENLGDAAAAARAAATFVEAFARSMPTGKQNTFANRTLPDAVVVVARGDQPVNLAGAFEDPVVRKDGRSVVIGAARALESLNSEVSHTYGRLHKAWVAGTSSVTSELSGFGTPVTLAELVEAVETTAVESLGLPQ